MQPNGFFNGIFKQTLRMLHQQQPRRDGAHPWNPELELISASRPALVYPFPASCYKANRRLAFESRFPLRRVIKNQARPNAAQRRSALSSRRLFQWCAACQWGLAESLSARAPEDPRALTQGSAFKPNCSMLQGGAVALVLGHWISGSTTVGSGLWGCGCSYSTSTCSSSSTPIRDIHSTEQQPL